MTYSPTEADIRHQITDYLNLKGWLVIPNIAGKLYVGDAGKTHPGIADLTALKDGRVVWIEVKRPKSKGKAAGTQSETQEQFQAAIEAHGGEYILAYGVGELISRGM